jgi:hypothetical protein
MLMSEKVYITSPIVNHAMKDSWTMIGKTLSPDGITQLQKGCVALVL